jgi:hypothetical protein
MLDVCARHTVDGTGDGLSHSSDHIAETTVFFRGYTADRLGHDQNSTASPVICGFTPILVLR